MTIADDLLDLAPFTVSAQNGALSGSGVWSASGSPVSLRSRVEVGPRTVTDKTGQEVVSSGLVVALGTLAHYDETLWRFTLPAPFDEPAGYRVALRIDPITDEDGTTVGAEIYLQ